MNLLIKTFLGVWLLQSAQALSVPEYEKVSLLCENPLTPQTTGKTPLVTNNSLFAIGSANRIFWQSSDGDKGYFQGPFAIGAQQSGIGQPGSSYECESFFYREIPPNKK